MGLHDKIYIYLGILLLLGGGWFATRTDSPLGEVAGQLTTTITVIAGGDVNLGRQTGQKILAGEVDYPFALMGDTLKSADIAFVNLESQLADLGGETQSPTNEYRFAGPPEGAKSLANAGIDIVSVANNHMWDYGKTALQETLRNLSGADVAYVGANLDPSLVWSPRILEVKGKKIAFLAMTNLLNGYENSGAANYVAFQNGSRLVEEIQKIRNEVDWVLVSLHSGAEYSAAPSSAMVKMAHELIDAGADAILAGHPHVPQPIEIYNEKPIFYSLGNFAFWQPFDFWTQHSFLAKLKLITPHQVEYEIILVNSGWQPLVLTDASTIEQLMARLNQNE
ncbi:MAG: hypothetical protein VE98_C0001G0385 [candidate division Kazan bacterium GW2011_GWA1_50_15]|uniref:Capsule synthesis protein CapA domain-containing protein n=2 Tax=Bacteria division Kazan-3B-28 TaxID=1798534 RepID=A0A0G1ZFC8_UNCK3|nr:MAG: hypothetical protein VE98_C0001G0385 [candidate division Kazan bacterium GW2011_GWA1_50_15]KKW25923.1 MAG: hypothetical protein VE99_C0001G0564 [candidate division Kazan bacterium GW2011_GWC1_52_13]KKW26577.1 MAG: hypothetical protein VF00_C0003G0007 [candidate division Kazan bacterium GW2011_GWB1_52_7]HAV65676.1 hypothetical protein [Patescibacteria group bacterium]HCR42624.1 hypothetical protein [Patescibacteria group bacterium]